MNEQLVENLVKYNILYNLSYWVQIYLTLPLDMLENYYPRNENDEEDEEGEYPEIYEWWAVTSSLYDELKDHGEVVFHAETGDYIWGRTWTGQSITLDYVIQKIAIEREEWRFNFLNGNEKGGA